MTDFQVLWKNMENNSNENQPIQHLIRLFKPVKIPKVKSPISLSPARTRQNFKYKIKLQLSCLPNLKFSTKFERIIELMDIYKSLTETQSASFKTQCSEHYRSRIIAN